MTTEIGKVIRVLVVDDDAMLRDFTVRILAKLGIDSRTAQHGQEAIEILRQSPDFDCVITDLMMPVMDGFETAHRIRNDLLLHDLPIIALTGSATDQQDWRRTDSDLDLYLEKPVEPTSLDQAIRHCLGRENTTVTAGNIVADQLPPNKHLDTALGLRAAGDDPDLYFRLLGRFITSLPDRCSRLSAAVTTNNGTEFEREVHTLAGILKTIGAVSLHHQVKNLEQDYLNTGRCPSFYVLQDLLQAMEDMSDAVAAIIPESGLSNRQITDGSEPDRLTQLQELITHSDTAALKLTEDLCRALDESHPLSKVNEYLQHYEFEEALKALNYYIASRN